MCACVCVFVQVLFGGTLAMLDLCSRVKDMKSMDLSHTRWCYEALCTTGRVSTILGQIAVRVDSIKKNRFADLVRIERDGGIDVVCLAIFWHSKVVGSVISHGGMSGASGSAADEAIVTSCQTPFALQLRDVVFSAQTVGVGLDLAAERFKRNEEEEKTPCPGSVGLAQISRLA